MPARSTSLLTTIGLFGASLVAIGGQFAFAGAASAGCAPDESQYWKASTVSYTPVSGVTGEHNSGSKAEDLNVTVSVNVTASTSVSANAGFSVSVGIAEVKTDLGVTVTKSVAKGFSATGKLNIPAHGDGSIEAAAQFTKFTKYEGSYSGNCTYHETALGSMQGITKDPYFLTCTGSATCKPHA